jgi:small subunit ribosomal protein S17
VPEEENNVNEEQAPEAAEQPDEAPAEEAPAEEAPAVEAPAEEPQAEEAPPEDAPAAEAEAEPAEAEAEPEEALSPKERRKRERSRHTGEANPPRSPEERRAERAQARRERAQERRRWRTRSRERRRGGGGAEPQAPVERAKARPQLRQGVVVSDKADKTITVRIDTQRPHRTYGKIVRTSSTLHAHDEGNEAHTGDTVRLVESRPLSATKRWRLVEVLERAR